MNAIVLEQNKKQKGVERIDITTRQFKKDPYPFYAQLRETQPVAPVRWGTIDAWLVTRYDDVAAMLKDPRFIKNQYRVQDAEHGKQQWVPGFLRPLQSNMLDQDDPGHARLRTLVHKAFTPARVEHLQTRIQSIADELINAALPKREMDLVRDFALPLPLTVIAELLGIPVQDRASFHKLAKELLRRPTTVNSLRIIPGIWFFLRSMRTLFEERRRNPQDDLLSALIQAEETGDHLSEDELQAMVFLLMVAGHETTVNLIGSGTLALLEHPEQLQQLRAQPEIIRPAVEELLRYTSPVETATERYALEDVTLEQVTIRKGQLTFAVLASANRDEHQFSKADELDLTRANNKHLAFGLGSHYCVGAPLARMEGAIAFNTLLQRMPELRLAVPADQLRWRATPVVRGLEALPVAF